MYIGAKPNVANFVMLDSITTSATATFNLTKDGVAYYPPNSLACIVSLNGIVQKATSSFNIVNNTIVFSQALTSNDVIDYILVMAEKIDLSIPADASVTNAKTNFVSTSSNAGLQIKGDGTTAGTLELRCENNSHGVKLRGSAHSNSPNYVLTMPPNDGNANQVLTTDGSGVLSFADASGGAFEKISTTTISSNVASVDFDTLSTNYRDFKIVISSLVINTHQEAVLIKVKRSGQSSYDGGSGEYRFNSIGNRSQDGNTIYDGSNSNNKIQLNSTSIASDGTVDGATFNATINVVDPHSTTNTKFFYWSCAFVEGAYGATASNTGAGYRYDTSETALIGVQIAGGGSTQFTSGTVTLYGRKI